MVRPLGQLAGAKSMRHVALLAGLWLAACGPSAGQNGDDTGGVDGGDTNQPDAYVGETGTINGIVWAPGNAPGMVPAGQEIPIYNALVWVSPTRPAGIPQETYCEPCVTPQGKHVFSDHKGNFSLGNIVPNTYWLIMQKGQFRYEQQIVVGTTPIQLPAEQTTLPSVQEPENGKWIPKMAIAVGNYDDLEDILGKMAVGSVDSSGRFVADSAAGRMYIYDNGGIYGGTTEGSLSSLVGSLAEMLKYHIIFIPCASTSNTAALRVEQNLKNMRDYVAAGGKLYVTDWSGEWMDNVFPAPVTLGPGEDTPATAYDPNTDTWNTSQFGDADGSSYTSNNAEAAEQNLHTWLNGQMGPTESSQTQSTYNASLFDVEGNWNTIEALTPVQVGVDDENLPVYDTPTAWVIGGQQTSLPKKPLTVTFEPAGCGRVLYSTYHTTDGTHVGLVPQERVLLYLIMEIGVCNDDPIVD